MIKLADRIVTLQPPPGHWRSIKIARYREERKEILQELGRACAYLSERLDQKKANYSYQIKR
jgi:(p)ppGpp synthase/HD superfamily hydrolase